MKKIVDWFLEDKKSSFIPGWQNKVIALFLLLFVVFQIIDTLFK
ncbi:MAG: hypothetical protein NTW98_00480 [Candidatus Nomurabacteria bacterium]|nr:hypothetical protein [Candidatus Nomurabacteria bacterium]